ncbi:MAG: 50S ribosomal protein L21 [Planctomycetota bacterium]
MYAILSDRGRQYKVQEGELVQIDEIRVNNGQEITFDQVLLLGLEGGQVKIGSPSIPGAKVTGVVEDHIKGDKTIAHHRVWTNSLGRRRGHRTKYTVVRIGKIQS